MRYFFEKVAVPQLHNRVAVKLRSILAEVAAYFIQVAVSCSMQCFIIQLLLSGIELLVSEEMISVMLNECVACSAGEFAARLAEVCAEFLGTNAADSELPCLVLIRWFQLFAV